MANTNKYRCGFVAIIGRPNVGKSTILNNILQKKTSITSKKPQTTQKQILGIKTIDSAQVVFIDTPGLHKELTKHQKNDLNKYMSRSANQALIDVDLVLFVISGTRWTSEEDWILDTIIKNEINPQKVILVINKIDKIKNKQELLPFVNKINHKLDFADIFYVSAEAGILDEKSGLKDLFNKIIDFLPEISGPDEYYFNPDDSTSQSKKQLASEIIREKIIRLSGEELPYSAAVEIKKIEKQENKNIINISADIWVERPGQKNIIIGKKGEKMKEIGSSARIDLEELYGCKVFLELWVRVKSNWSGNQRIMKDLGFDDEI